MHKCYCETSVTYLNYLGFLFTWGGLVTFSVPPGQKNWVLVRLGDQYPDWHYDEPVQFYFDASLLQWQFTSANQGFVLCK